MHNAVAALARQYEHLAFTTDVAEPGLESMLRRKMAGKRG
jgi:hypothetical protein